MADDYPQGRWYMEDTYYAALALARARWWKSLAQSPDRDLILTVLGSDDD